jgi:hypothetical protein
VVKNIVLSKEIKKQEKGIFKNYMEANKGADKNAVNWLYVNSMSYSQYYLLIKEMF